jgi:hypothetical protein
MCQDKTMAGVEAVDAILWDPEQPGSTRVAAWCALRDTGFDKPAQRVAFKDYTEHPAGDLSKSEYDLERFADLYAIMIGASPAPPPIIDITPARRYVDPTQRQKLRQMTDEPRQMAEEEQAEQEAERHASRPQPEPARERLRRPQR